jgi:ABC-type branched-subunit amino acid transport system permease subunit
MRIASEDLVGLVVLAGFALVPAFAPEYLVADLGIYFAYALFAVSLGFAWGHCGLLSLGHAIYFGLGAYAMSVTTLGMLPGLPWLVSTWAGLLAAVSAAAAAAALLGLLFFAAGGLRGAFFGIVTLATAVIVERIAIQSDWLGGLNGLMGVPPITLGLNGGGPMIFEPVPLYWVMLTVLAVLVAAMRRVVMSPFGLTLKAIDAAELRVETLGVDVVRAKVRAYALSGAVAGLAGALFVAQFGFASPSLIGFAASADVLIWVALGGRGALVAAALGAIAVRYAESRLSGSLGAAWPLVLGMLFMSSVVLFRSGLFGEAIALVDRIRSRRRAVLAKPDLAPP